MRCRCALQSVDSITDSGPRDCFLSTQCVNFLISLSEWGSWDSGLDRESSDYVSSKWTENNMRNIDTECLVVKITEPSNLVDE